MDVHTRKIVGLSVDFCVDGGCMESFLIFIEQDEDVAGPFMLTIIMLLSL